MIRILSIGECMIELTHRDRDTLSLGFAGDTFNTAVYLSRLTNADEVQVDYLTLLGDDHYSERVLEAMRAEGIGTELIRQIPGTHPGLYLVRTDDRGERSFTYYRSESPARRLFEHDPSPDIDDHDAVYLSAITLQILTADARNRLCGLLRQVRERGGHVVFDSNYRASGWGSVAEARDAIRAAWELTSIGLPTFSDEQAVFEDPSPAATVERLRAHGVADVVVKNGAQGCTFSESGGTSHVASEPVEHVVDSTAAGDAFNAGYLAERLAGTDRIAAMRRAHALAAQVIQHPGAIVSESVCPRRGSAAARKPPWV